MTIGSSTAKTILIALGLLVLASYGRVGSFAFVDFDDGEYVYDNSQVRAGLTLTGVFWASAGGRSNPLFH